MITVFEAYWQKDTELTQKTALFDNSFELCILERNGSEGNAIFYNCKHNLVAVVPR